MLRLKKTFILFCIFAVLVTFFLFNYSDIVLQEVEIDDILKDDLMRIDGGNHTKWIEDFFERRKEFLELSSVKQYPPLKIIKIPSASEEDTKYLDEFFDARKQFNLSAEGRYLYLNEPPPEKRSKKFKILIWKFGKMLERRHLYYFHQVRHEPFANCSVNNCFLDYEESSVADADAVVVLLHRLNGIASLPNVTRPAGQRWVFLNDESPYNVFNQGHGKWTDLDGLFNWSMTFKTLLPLLQKFRKFFHFPFRFWFRKHYNRTLNEEYSEEREKRLPLHEDSLMWWKVNTHNYPHLSPILIGSPQQCSQAEADVPVPYGRVIPRASPVFLDDSLDFQSKFTGLVPHAVRKRRDVLAAVLMSNCGKDNDRLKYLKELQEHIKVDFYGHCSPDPELRSGCPGSYGDDCPKLEEYLFYLAFENSACDEYITEKTYCHAYRKGNIPVVMGNRAELLNVLLPPNSFINAYDFESPKALAEKMLFINSTMETNYLQYQDWRKTLEVVNEHGYFNAPSLHYCRLCEALNYNDEKPKVYGLEDLAKFLNPATNCQKHT